VSPPQLFGQIKVKASGIIDRRGHRAVLFSIAITPGKIGKKENPAKAANVV
jgi:hypothetical protein